MPLNLTLIFRDPKFRDSNERDYAVSILEAWEWSISRVFFGLALLSWLPILFGAGTDGLTREQSKVLLGYSLLRGIFIIVLFMVGKLKTWSKPSIFWMMIIGQFVWTYVAMMGSASTAPSSTVTRIWILLMFTGNLFMPLRSWAHHAILIISMPTFALAMWNHTYAELAIAIAFFAIVSAQSAQIFMNRMLKEDAIRTYREKSKYIPRQVLTEAAREKKSISEVFKPAHRFCVCICADWRNLHELLDKVDETKLGNDVVHYYQKISELLETNYPKGNYFVDWIADELFIVIFETDDESRQKICGSALNLVYELGLTRDVFSQKLGYPSGIDVGVSAGNAVVGVFGHDGIAKATAFGETAGVARRLQTVAKKALPPADYCDRVVTSNHFTFYLDQLTTTPKSISLKEAIKDLNDTSVLSWTKSDLMAARRVP
jgi:class 3 adenylate cyclase